MAASTPLLRRHGYPVSSCFNTVRAALIEKGEAGDCVPARAAWREPALKDDDHA